MSFVGESAALSAAVVWAIATWIYGQFSHQFSAFQLNYIKGVVASTLMVVAIVFTGAYDGLAEMQAEHIWILAVSGVIGIAIGDSAYFAALKRIGANKTLLLEALAPPLSGVLALMVLGTQIPMLSWLGVLVTTMAVTYVVFEPNDAEAVDQKGILFGLLASACQATGVVISHFALVAGDVDPLVGALVRLSVGTLAVWLGLRWIQKVTLKQLLVKWREMQTSQQTLLMCAIVIGTFLALWLQQIALKFASPAIAQTLIATSPIFILMIFALRGERITLKQAMGTLLAVVGISLFFVR
jgi:drug/metabolite transporter (DMT)-like permease